MNRSTMSRLEKLEDAIKPEARQHVIFGSTYEIAEAQIAARKASGEIGENDNVIVVSWMSPEAVAS